MPLIHCGTVADDDGDEIVIEAEAPDGEGPGDVHVTINNGGCVALRGDQIDRAAKAWAEASRIAEGGAAGE